ncbi:MAG: S9 family peptidase [Candidatus Eremiobacteraeota bacterium]|nr:S9 family peptidase [Candidatus Eremiobacteraeota bacterium]
MTDVAWISASPDGSRIAYTSEETGSWQIWVANADGSHRRQLTEERDGVDFATWVPRDAHTILFSKSTGNSGVDQFYYLRDDRPGSVPLFPNETTVAHRFGAFSVDGAKLAFSSNLRKENAFDVYVLDRRTNETHRIYTVDNGNASATSWSADDTQLLVRQAITPYDDNLYAVDLRRTAARLMTPHSGQATFQSAQFTPDGRSILCVTDLNQEFHTIQRISTLTLAIRPVFALAHDVDEVLLSPDGQRMAYIVNDDGFGNVVVADEDGRTIGKPVMPPYIAENLLFMKGGGILTYAASGPTFPKVIWSYDLQSHQTVQILKPNFHGIRPETLVQPTIVRVRSFDGTLVPAWYFRPKAHRGPLTTLLDIHGGPEEQDRAWFYPAAQYLASRGYALLDPNIRGSTGYGRMYLHAADARKREDAVKDVKALRDWLVTSGDARANGVFIDGASYGGYVVLSSLYNYPRAFAGGIDIYGVADWIDFLEKTAPARRAYREGVYGSLDADREFLASISPINHAEQFERPVLIIAGANDKVVPLEQSERIARSLQSRGIPVELHVFGNEGHGIQHLENLIAVYKWMAIFLDRYGPH